MAKGLNFIHTEGPEAAAEFTARQILAALQTGRQVLWLVSGGSAIAVAVAAAAKLGAVPPSHLTVTLADERYGAVGHADSNWQKLTAAGFTLANARLLPVLAGADFSETTRVFNDRLAAEFKRADYVIALLGIGPDGHTAGILPSSPAVTATDLVAAYEGPDFQRITITPAAIGKLSEAIVYSVGANKWPALKQLRREIAVTDQPAQILKTLDKLTIFTDYKD